MKLRNHHAGCCGTNPTRRDGTEWPHVLLLHDGSMLHADTAGEIVEELVPGYARADDAGRLRLRIAHAQRTALAAQELRIAHAEASGLLAADGADEGPLVDIMRLDKGESLLLETDDRPGAQADWEPDLPLYLVTTSYAPHAEHPPIGGNVLWLDPTSDAAYLTSLAAARIYSYWAQRP